MADALINPQIHRNLSDKLYEKRKIAALEIEKLTRDLVSKKEFNKIESLIDLIKEIFSNSSQPHSRNGGLIALAAIAIALGPLVTMHLQKIVPPIIEAFSDNDSRVRYYACESMYNVGKVAKTNILQWFNEIFDALTKLSIDVELSVKNGAELLDRLIKDIVTEKSSYYASGMQRAKNIVETEHPLSASPPPEIYPPVPGSTAIVGGNAHTFNLPRFIPLLKERIHVINAPGRLFLVQWIFVLNSIPQLDLLTYLPEFLDGLFVYLSDPNVDVRTATLNVLGDFLKEITKAAELQFESGGIKKLVNQSADTDFTGPVHPDRNIILDFGKMTEILAKYLSSKDEETQATALRWVSTFIGLARTIMLPFIPLLLGAILPTLSHPVAAIRSLAIDANTNLFTLVFDWSIQDKYQNDPFDIPATVVTLMALCQDEHEDTRVGSLEWLLMLHKKYPEQVMSSSKSFFNGLLKTLTDYSEEVVRRDLLLLAQISYSSDDEYFTKFMVNLLNLFTIDRRLLETRGSLIIRQLCSSLNPERMYRSFGEILEREADLEFASTMVQTLNLILITAPELNEMRKRLKNVETKDGSALFLVLYRSWCHNPIAVFSLCLLCQAYEHASNLISCFGDLEITVPFLVQTDKLVQLLESPVFTGLRLQLLEPEKYPHLYKCLYGILMLLPQSSAFATLRNRLNSISSLAMLNVSAAMPNVEKNPKRKTNSAVNIDQSVNLKWNELLVHFKTVQSHHEQALKLSKPKNDEEEKDVLESKREIPRRNRSGSLPLTVPTIPSKIRNNKYKR